MSTTTFPLASLRYERGNLMVIDQLKLPHELEYVQVKDADDAWSVIRSMQVRGAPLIAIVAALGLAVDVYSKSSTGTLSSPGDVAAYLQERMVYLRTSRPTAVNLFVATDELRVLVDRLASSPDATVSSIVEGFILYAEELLAKDVATNKSIGDFGAKRILEITGKEKVKVLTICNTGSLATAGYGTALGVIRSLHAAGRLEQVYACETRPYNQGARLTAFEIVQDGLPGTLIADSMASYLMATKGVDCVVVGADRVAANGDTANKVGTYQLAIAAKYHGVPFFAAVPTTTLDLSMANGSTIHVELRPEVELTSIFGQKIAPDGIPAWNPSFDVTPCSLIKGIITELGVAEAAEDAGADGIIDIPKFLKDHGQADRALNAASPSSFPSGYKRMDETLIGEYLLTEVPSSRGILGVASGEEGLKQLSVSEVGDGNLNFVYIVNGPRGSLIVKQALPYVRCVGESWPLTLERATFETNALREERKWCPDLVPEVYHFDAAKALIVMRYVEPPHLILRKHFIAGLRLPLLAGHISTFLAETLFGNSAINLEGGTFRLKVSQWSRNTALCALTEQVIFTDPYVESSNNRWTSPQLDSIAAEIKKDDALKLAIAELKTKFVSSTESLLHGDLHSGSVMAHESSTFVIDPEFAFYGPMGFDIGAFLANVLLAYFSQEAHHGGAEYAEWLLSEVFVNLYKDFERKFVALWDSANAEGKGELYKNNAFPPESSALKAAQSSYLARLFKDSIGFAGAKMIRRIVGIAHVADLESIIDPELRSKCEKKSLNLARMLVLASSTSAVGGISSVDEVATLARGLFSSAEPPVGWL